MSKRITIVALAVLMLLMVALPAGAVIQATSVEIRGEVHFGPGVIGSALTGQSNASWNATNFAGLWYDLKDNLKTEVLNLTQNISTRDIPSNSLYYNTSKAPKYLKVFQNGKDNVDVRNAFGAEPTYNIVGWQAAPYVAIKNKANKLSKLLIEQGNATAEKKSLTIGETWDVGDGWTVTAQSIDAKASPRQVWLVLSKDGVKQDDKVIAQNGTYVYVEKSFGGETDVPLFLTYIDSVFAGATSDMVQLRYTWAISKSVTEVKTNDKFGNMEVQVAGENQIQLMNEDVTITLTRDSTVDVMGDVKFKVADSPDANLRFYPMVLRTAPGIHEVRGAVASGAGVQSWNATSFAGFWYDLKDNLTTEVLTATQGTTSGDTGAEIASNSLFYNTSKAAKYLKVYQNQKDNVDVRNAFGAAPTYNVVGWQAQPYVAVKSKANKLSKLLLEQGNATAEKKSLTIGETWDVGDGWTVTAQSIDAKASPRQVWLVLSKDGVKLDDKVIAQNDTYVYVEKSFAGETDVPLFVTYVDSVFAGATSDMVQLRYTWAISKSVTEVKTNDKFGNMEVQVAGENNVQLMNEDAAITLSRNSKVDVMGEIKFRVSDSTALRYYPMVEYEIKGVGVTPTPTATVTGVTPTPTKTPTNVTVTATPAVVATTAPAMTEKTPAKPAATPKEPGFEAVFAIAGLLAVAYLVLRQKK